MVMFLVAWVRWGGKTRHGLRFKSKDVEGNCQVRRGKEEKKDLESTSWVYC